MELLFIKKSSLLRDGIIELLKRQFVDSRITCCDEKDEHMLIHLGEKSDLIIIDIHTPVSVEPLARHLSSLNKKVIAWVEDINAPCTTSLFAIGLNGYLYYDIDERTLTKAINFVLEGKRFVSPVLASCLVELYARSQSKQLQPPIGVLSKREWEVLQLLVKGYSNVRIANELFLSDKTVKNYVSSILNKLEVPDRTNAVLKALKEQWIYL
ncbi:two-component system, NarL family, response regulator DegU [Amphibacillus marinus]|uniref:Two-component system, NarL family, response regulator DegU n=1 Tax=Amphibacillus marinus TaxID=872970 RepID=A0A1H8MFY9_9BACI|nr:response regulator transcription factor [Amphibacillus marinus]SEO16210.1 two-component system, NarL family, response regulator DegU [Amphibacillus marinus]